MDSTENQCVENSSEWKWKYMKSLSLEERDKILQTAAEAAMNDYKYNRELKVFDANGDMYDEYY